MKTLAVLLSALTLIATVGFGSLILQEERDQTDRLARISQCLKAVADGDGAGVCVAEGS